ncbi:MAG: hypothetical protein ACLQIB_42555 [Isosphaeraceae bacterium]
MKVVLALSVACVLVLSVALAPVWLGGGDGASALPLEPSGNSAAAPLAGSPDPAAVASEVRAALRAGNYPWYDADSGKVRALVSRKPAWTKSLGDQLAKLGRQLTAALERIGKFFSRFSPGRGHGLAASGDALMTILLWIALAGLLIALARLWYRRQGLSAGGSPDRARPGRGAVLAELAGADRQMHGDPWSEAVTRRAAGDLAGAIVYLFIHQLLSLDQIGMIRLAPGVTGRQYVSGLGDEDLRRSLGATLGLFEEVHYGHRRPSAAAFEGAWSRAIAFRRDVLGARDER